MSSQDTQTTVALDLGSVRTGVAIGNSFARLARPWGVISTENFLDEFTRLVESEGPSVIVVGLPRSLAGNHTAQTDWVESFVAINLKSFTVVFQDEALTSEKAEADLKTRKKPYSRGDIDALAATYILQDYFDNVRM